MRVKKQDDTAHITAWSRSSVNRLSEGDHRGFRLSMSTSDKSGSTSSSSQQDVNIQNDQSASLSLSTRHERTSVPKWLPVSLVRVLTHTRSSLDVNLEKLCVSSWR